MDRSDTYNIILGGQEMGRKGPLTDEHKRKLSESHKGKPPWNKGKRLSDEYKCKLSDAHKGKPTWLSTHRLSKTTIARIAEKLRGRIPTNAKRVCQYTLDGNFVAEYNSSMEAHRTTGISNISMCCRGERTKAGGYVWRWKDGE